MKRFVWLVITGIFSLLMAVCLPYSQVQGMSPPLIQQGQAQYQAGQYAAAAQSLGQGAATFHNSGQLLAEARTLGLQVLALEKLGRWSAAHAAIDQSLLLIKDLRRPGALQPNLIAELNLVEAQVLSSLGQLVRSQGDAKTALTTWQSAELLYQQENDSVGVLGSRINQIKALETLGFYRRAEQRLAEVSSQIEALPESPLKARGLLSLGTLLRLEGQLQASEETLKQGVAIVQSQQQPQLQSQLLLSLANTERLQASRARSQNLARTRSAQEDSTAAYLQSALSHYETAEKLTRDSVERAQIQLNHFSLLLDTKMGADSNLDAALNTQVSTAALQKRAKQMFELLSQLPVSRRSIYAKVNFIQQLMRLQQSQVALSTKGLVGGLSTDRLVSFLQQTVRESQQLDDGRAQSYALGTLGHWFEIQGNGVEAKSLSQQALIEAERFNASEIAYQWQWQLGRILQTNAEATAERSLQSASKVDSEALDYYRAAYSTLNVLRSDLVTLSPDIQFSFRERVEPVYRELVELLLREPQEEQLFEARHVIEDLQLAELDNFFRDACAQVQSISIDDVDPNAAIVYPIVLEDRLEIILKLPGDSELRHFVQPDVTAQELESTIRKFRSLSVRRSTSLEKLTEPAQQLYDWLIAPLADDLEADLDRDVSQIKTLSFVLDGDLRGVPMGALHDGEHFLVERYGIALTPGLQLLDPQQLARQNLQILLSGAENAPSFQAEGLSPLENVPLELQEIRALMPQSDLLSEQQFRQQNINDFIQRQPYNIVHLATHGQFSSDPEQTFILDWDRRINVAEIDRLLQLEDSSRVNGIELLVLSACETAKGDSRAALGLAGVAIRAGARSTLATLWQVNDASTAEFMKIFYQQLSQTNLSKAEVLRNTQLSFLRDYPDSDLDRPYHWAPFILIGNWL